MYLKTVLVENVGPISNLDIETPFQDGLPQPLVLVGPNGSGKSTLLSFFVNALVGFKQQVVEEAEVEQTRVYRVRSRMFLRGGTHWYHARVEFEEGLSLDEWLLDRPKQQFEKEVSPLPTTAGWQEIGGDESDKFLLTPQRNRNFQPVSPKLEKLFSENVVLFFPSDRFELPDWLNEQSLAAGLRFPEPVPFKGQTSRRIFSRALLRPTLEWLKGVVLDSRLSDYERCPIQLPDGSIKWGLIPKEGRDSQIIEFVKTVLARVLGADSDNVRFLFSHRNIGTISVEYMRSGRRELLPNLLGLSAGQAALFCLFCNIIRDGDLAGAQFREMAGIRGIVILDEADLHLHVNLQYRVLPELMKLFPKIQYIVTAHSPLFVMGMENSYGVEGFRVIELPSGEQIETERFSEFEQALDVFVQTRTFDQCLLDRVQNAPKPVVLVEGKTDVTHLQVAWEKLYPGLEAPWDVESCGGDVGVKVGRGGAMMLKVMLETFCLRFDRPLALGLFDHDREGKEQFLGLQAAGFSAGKDETHRQHSKASVQATLLPVPPGRKNFVSPQPKCCYLAVEHYYSDILLKHFGVADSPVVADSAVFGITSDSTKKIRFANELKSLDKSEFENFRALFERLAHLLAVQIQQGAVSPASEVGFVHHLVCAPYLTPETALSVDIHSSSLETNKLESDKPASATDAAKVDAGEMSTKVDET